MTVPRGRSADGARSRIDEAFRAFVTTADFSCLAAKGLVRQEGYRLAVYGSLGSAASTLSLARDLALFAHDPPPTGGQKSALTAFVAVFRGRAPATERAFERRLWRQLQRIHDCDRAPWDPTVTADPEDPHFSFSVAGRAMFVVGLHPHSSRLARRFRWPTLVFNPHAQFERLRDEFRFDSLRRAIRERELALQGSLNPNLADFGERSEARQYSGRQAEPDWRCPFQRAAL
ncbi:MAG: guanitoxin biosynthesis heme-dependent pre-guanitoxin N-hydroxylase GntA [Gemmatimonadaceae bacterium]